MLLASPFHVLSKIFFEMIWQEQQEHSKIHNWFQERQKKQIPIIFKKTRISASESHSTIYITSFPNNIAGSSDNIAGFPNNIAGSPDNVAGSPNNIADSPDNVA